MSYLQETNEASRILATLLLTGLQAEGLSGSHQRGKEAMTALYRHFDNKGVLLYVGIAEDESRRRKEHGSSSAWFKHAASVTIEEYESRSAARLAEKEAIETESPIHNKAGRPSTKTKHPIRNIRIEDATWKKLVKLAAPENVSVLVRKVLRDYVGKEKK